LRAHATAVVLEGIAKQTEATYDLLDHFHREYQRLKSARRALRFEDLTLRLAAAAQMFQLFGAQSDVFFRLDQRTEHLLLDEFQDTSRLQWLVLEPLAKEIVAHAEGRSFFCVGDVKQAIYGWRGGESELFDYVGRQLPSLEWKDLAVSYRSAQPVVDVVNQVFAGIAGNTVLGKDPATTSAAEHWRRGFVEHRTARTELVGYVRCSAGPAPLNEETPKEASYRGAGPTLWRKPSRRRRRSKSAFSLDATSASRGSWRNSAIAAFPPARRAAIRSPTRRRCRSCWACCNWPTIRAIPPRASSSRTLLWGPQWGCRRTPTNGPPAGSLPNVGAC